MTSDEYAEIEPSISAMRALELVKMHSASIPEFFHEFGEKGPYDTAAVLGWLGY